MLGGVLMQVENIKAEDVECLVKLLVTIGAPLDANPKNKDRMEAYFSRLGRLSAHPKLESRHKFMVQVCEIVLGRCPTFNSGNIQPAAFLTACIHRNWCTKGAQTVVPEGCYALQDVIELRAHNWVARRKVEGPKKIEDIHKDARMELQRQRMAPMPDRGDRRRGGPPMDRAPLPQCAPFHHNSHAATQPISAPAPKNLCRMRGCLITFQSAERDVLVWRFRRRPVERSDRVDAPIRPMNRAPSQEWLTQSSLRPGGGAPRTSPAEPTVSLRPGGPGAAGAGAGARSASGSSLRCGADICDMDALRKAVAIACMIAVRMRQDG